MSDDSADLHLPTALAQPGAFPNGESVGEVIQTHISWVFLTETHAYKLKKPVHFEFVDFSTLAARRVACEDEVRLNRRLATGIYLGILPVVRADSGHIVVGAQGDVIDWIVQMVRLPADRTLERRLRMPDFDVSEVLELPGTLARFYRAAARMPVTGHDYCAALHHHSRANRKDLLESTSSLVHPVIKQIHTAQLAIVEMFSEQLAKRATEGHVVDGHGDLRPEHVYLVSPPKIVDCVEFSRELRQVDIVDDLSFLAMECERLGAASLGHDLMRSCLFQLDEQPANWLVHFYISYRACVRAKVSALLARQKSGEAQRKCSERVEQYLAVSCAHAKRLGSRWLLLVRGTSGTGKSTLARELADRLGLEHLQTDAIRRNLEGVAPRSSAFDEDAYAPDKRQGVYDEMYLQCHSLMAQGLSVVLDGTFLRADQRRRVAGLAREMNANFAAVRCDCPSEVAKGRIERRLRAGSDLSEAWPALVDRQRSAEERDPEDLSSINIDTTTSLETQYALVVSHLSSTLQQ